MPGTSDRGRTNAQGAWRRGAVAAALLPLLLFLAACGDSADEPPMPPAPVPAAGAPAPATVAAAADTPEPTPPPVVTEVTPAPAIPAPAPVDAPAAPAVTENAPLAPAAAATEPNPVPATPPAAEAAPTGAVAPPVPAPATEGTTPPPTDPALVARLAAADPDAGRVVAARCGACHAFVAGAPDGVGPNLFDIVGAPVGAAPGFAYSPAFIALAATGATWTFDLLDAFLASPQLAVPGTRMGFGGLSDATQRANLVAHLRTLSDDPVPLPGEPAADPLRAEIMALGLAPVAFTTEQVQIGRDTYARYCSTCHGTSFQGIWYGAEWGQAPALIGDRFEQRWFLRPLEAFVTAMEETDIAIYASLHQGLSPGRYVAVAAYLLEQYGFAAGEVALPVEPEALRGIGFWQPDP